MPAVLAQPANLVLASKGSFLIKPGVGLAVWTLLVFGITMVLLVFDSALRTFVLPRGATPVVSRGTFIGLRMVFNAIARAARTYDGRDSVMAQRSGKPHSGNRKQASCVRTGE